MQLLPAPVDSVAAHRGIEIIAVLAVEVLPKLAKVVIGFLHMMQVPNHELHDNDIVEVANDRDVVGQYILGITKVDEYSE